MVPRFVLVGLLVSIQVESAIAACNVLSKPMQSPIDGVRLDLVRGSDLSAGKKAVHVETKQTGSSDPHADIYEGLIQGKSFGRFGGSVLYREPGVDGKDRLCREEVWISRTETWHGVTPPRVPAEELLVPYRPTPDQERNPILKGLVPHFFVRSVYMYLYDDAGRLVEVRRADGDEQKLKPMRRDEPSISGSVYCAVYDRQGRMIQSSRLPPHTVLASCDALGRGKTDLLEYHYRDDGRLAWYLNSHPVRAEARVEYPELGVWNATGRMRLGDTDDFADLEANEKHGVALLRAVSEVAGPLAPRDAPRPGPDIDPAETRLSAAKVTYHFPTQPVPLEMLGDGFSRISEYERVRVSDFRYGVMDERFEAGRTTPSRRVWTDPRSVFREERLDENGRIRRAINRYYPFEDRGYAENLRAYAEKGVLKVTPTQGYGSYRMYEYDEAGVESLVMVCWRYQAKFTKLVDPLPWWTGTKRSAAMEKMLKAPRDNDIQTACGAPDGSKVVADNEYWAMDYFRKTYDYARMRYSYREPR